MSLVRRIVFLFLMMGLITSAISLGVLVQNPGTSYAEASQDKGKVPCPKKEHERDKGVGAQIVCGKPVPDGVYPFVAALYDARKGKPSLDTQICTGTLISPIHVLTAAHCVVRTKPSDTVVAVDRTNLNSNGGELRKVVEIFIPENYHWNTDAHDLAVLTLNSPVETLPARIAGPGDEAFEAPGTVVTAAGWGSLNPDYAGQKDNGARYDKNLREARIRLVSDRACASAYHRTGSENRDWNRHITKAVMVCGEWPRTDTCYGDSGGPLFVITPENEFVVVAITSTGNGCADKRYPGIYTQVLPLHDVIQQAMAA